MSWQSLLLPIDIIALIEMQNLLNPSQNPHIDREHEFLSGPTDAWIRAYSSAGEHFVDIEGVTGSIPVTPTIPSQRGKYKLAHHFCDVRKRRRPMKVKSSLRSLKARHRDCRVVRRKGRVYVINKTQPRFKARQG